MSFLASILAPCRDTQKLLCRDDVTTPPDCVAEYSTQLPQHQRAIVLYALVQRIHVLPWMDGKRQVATTETTHSGNTLSPGHDTASQAQIAFDKKNRTAMCIAMNDRSTCRTSPPHPQNTFLPGGACRGPSSSSSPRSPPPLPSAA